MPFGVTCQTVAWHDTEPHALGGGLGWGPSAGVWGRRGCGALDGIRMCESQSTAENWEGGMACQRWDWECVTTSWRYTKRLLVTHR